MKCSKCSSLHPPNHYCLSKKKTTNRFIKHHWLRTITHQVETRSYITVPPGYISTRLNLPLCALLSVKPPTVRNANTPNLCPNFTFQQMLPDTTVSFFGSLQRFPHQELQELGCAWIITAYTVSVAKLGQISSPFWLNLPALYRAAAMVCVNSRCDSEARRDEEDYGICLLCVFRC